MTGLQEQQRATNVRFWVIAAAAGVDQTRPFPDVAPNGFAGQDPPFPNGKLPVGRCIFADV